MLTNRAIRITAKVSNVPLWRVANALAISEATLYRKLRHELPDEEKQKILAIIDQLKEETN